MKKYTAFLLLFFALLAFFTRSQTVYAQSTIVSLAQNKLAKEIKRQFQTEKFGTDCWQTLTGDFTGDGLADVAIHFCKYPQGGNDTQNHFVYLFQNLGAKVKCLGYYYYPNLRLVSITKGKVHIEKLDYRESDGRCCPSIITPHVLTIKKGKVF